MKRLIEWFRGPVPRSLFSRMRRKKTPGLERLYVLHTDHPISPEQRVRMNESLQPLREMYEIDFFVLEPGIKLKRFDEI